MLTAGALVVFVVMFFWWRDVIRESRTPGVHTPIVRLGLRYGMLFFITSEVMFFVAFFWSFFNFALFPDNVSGLANPIWPPPNIHTPDPFHLAILMTMILLLSGTTITWAHHSLIEGNRKGMIAGLGLTVLLGLWFTATQLWEYTHAPFKLVGGGVYPSVFYLATGFHGFHVIVGTSFLIVCWFRAPSRTVHAGTPFRLRGRGLVLALRRCGVAVPVHLHLLVGRQPDRCRPLNSNRLDCCMRRWPAAARAAVEEPCLTDC